MRLTEEGRSSHTGARDVDEPNGGNAFAHPATPPLPKRRVADIIEAGACTSSALNNPCSVILYAVEGALPCIVFHGCISCMSLPYEYPKSLNGVVCAGV